MPNTAPQTPPLSQSHSTCPEEPTTAADWPPNSPSWRGSPSHASTNPRSEPRDEAHLDTDEHPSTADVPPLSAPIPPSVVAAIAARDDDSTPATSRSATLSPSPQLAQETSTPTSPHSGVDNAMDLAKYADGEQEPSARGANLDFDSRASGADQARSSLTTESDRSLDFRELETRADENSATSLGPDYPNLRVCAEPSPFILMRVYRCVASKLTISSCFLLVGHYNIPIILPPAGH